MAAWSTIVFSSKREMDDYLNGSLLGGVDLFAGADVDGKTFIIDVGAGNLTTTFAPAKSRLWKYKEIIAEIESTDATLVGVVMALLVGSDRPTVVGRRSRIVLKLVDDTLTVRGNGTANEELGFTEGATPGDDTVLAQVATADVNSVHFHVAEQDTWTVLIYA